MSVYDDLCMLVIHCCGRLQNIQERNAYKIKRLNESVIKILHFYDIISLALLEKKKSISPYNSFAKSRKCFTLIMS
jgi:hypothetical protein